MKKKRTKARELVLQVLFELDLKGILSQPEGEEVSLPGKRVSKEVQAFALRLINGTIEKLSSIDPLIAAYTKDWKLERLSFCDRNILRLSLYELLYCPDIPPAVTINEAVELAKVYSTSESPKFINGVLDNININEIRVREQESC